MSNLLFKTMAKQNNYLLMRRLVQIFVLVLFLIGPSFSFWIIKGDMSASKLFGVIPLNDPFVFIQSLLSGFMPMLTAWIGVTIVMAFYMVVGGRSFCAWVCPVNMITDLASYLRDKLGIKHNINLSNHTRYYLLVAIFANTLLFQTLFYETINPVHGIIRFIIFFSLTSLWAAIIIFVIDLFLIKRGWCGHLCPMGAFYSLLTIKSLVRVRASKISKCNQCMDCVRVCPEPQIIVPILKNTKQPQTIKHISCTNCARCIEVCELDVFELRLTSFNFFNEEKNHEKQTL